jgi:hypothetical protein
MTTALELITGAARLLNVVRKGEPLDADEAIDGLATLNELLASWSNEGLNITSRERESFTIDASGSYTIGSGATLNTVRPIAIINAFIRIGNIDYPLMPITDEQYDNIALKTIDTGYPQFISYNNAYPTGTIKLYPKGSGQLHLLSEKPLTSIASLSTTVDLPAGWLRALRYNLALELAPEYGVEVKPVVAVNAVKALGLIKRAVARAHPIMSNSEVVTPRNIYTGWYV